MTQNNPACPDPRNSTRLCLRASSTTSAYIPPTCQPLHDRQASENPSPTEPQHRVLLLYKPMLFGVEVEVGSMVSLFYGSDCTSRPPTRAVASGCKSFLGIVCGRITSLVPWLLSRSAFPAAWRRRMVRENLG